MFCQKCGSILLPKKEGNRKVLSCSCGYKTSNVEKLKITETVKKTGKDIEVIENGDLETLPKTDAECDKCGHRTAYFWLVQTRAGDEPETKFLRCEKCKHTWRDYD
jgi:transcription factor S